MRIPGAPCAPPPFIPFHTDTMAHETLKPRKVHKTAGYSHATKVGNLLFIAGQVAKDSSDRIVGKGDITAQAKQVFENLKNVLGEAGGNLGQIFKMTTLVTHPSYVEPYRAVRNQYLKEPFPANTLHVVQALASPEWMIEIEAIASLD
jgi:enamine deaminase RidA (YjgF/YER057c/UK114 family)